MKKNIFILVRFIIGCYVVIMLDNGCAQVGFPTGGPKDTIAPVLAKALPEQDKTNFKGKKITLTFNEYIELKDLQANILVSPLQKNNPLINSNLKTITIRFRDTLLPNTTYSVSFGNAIADAPDSAVKTKKPDYITRLHGDGTFKFTHLPAGIFKVYALKDGDGGKTYNSRTEIFAFADTGINTEEDVTPVMLFAYAEEKGPGNTPPAPSLRRPPEKKLKYTTNLVNSFQDLLQPLQITFNSGLKTFDSMKFVVSDTNFKPLQHTLPTIDSSRSKVSINISWQPETPYYFILPRDAVQDSAGNLPEKTDTLRFVTRKTSDYGSILLRFKNIDLQKHPVIQFVQSGTIKFSYPVTAAEWSNKQFPPGEYEIRILYDTNNNGSWDPGNYERKLQPERAIPLPQKLAVKADWDNERDIQL